MRAIPALLATVATGILDVGKAMTLAALSNPWTIAAAALIGLGLSLYHFRDSLFTLKGTTYEIRDIWNAAWIVMGNVLHWIGGEFEKLISSMEKLWAGFTAWFSGSWIASEFQKVFGDAFSAGQRRFSANSHRNLRSTLSTRQSASAKLLPINPHPGLQRLRRRRVTSPRPWTRPASEKRRRTSTAMRSGSWIRRSQHSRPISAASLDAEPGKLQEVEAAEKARAEILKLNNSLVDAGRPKLTAKQEATITEKIATEESTKALVDYGKELVGQQHSADLSIQQTRAMAAANLEGDAAVRIATVDNAILGLTYNRTAEQLAKMAPELAKLRTELTAKSNIDIVAGANKEIDGLRDQLTERQILTAATLDSVNAQRDAALASKLYTLNQSIADSTDQEARAALLAKRDALIAVTHAEWDAADAQSALALLSPTDQLNREMDSLNHAVEALKALQDGTLTYGEELQIAAKQQDEFNRATDATIELLLREGSLGDGLTAFFLKMQEQAKTTAATIYDVLNETITKLSSNITDLITAPNRWSRQKVEGQFGQQFEDVGKTLLDSTIKQQMQGGLGALAKAFHKDLPSVAAKMDGSAPSSALWVRWATANGSPITGLGQGSETTAESSSSPAGIFDSITAKVFGGGNELDRLPGGTTANGSASPGAASGSNELGDLLGPTPGPTPPSVNSAPASVQGGGSPVLVSPSVPQAAVAGIASIAGAAAKTQPGAVGIFGGIASALGSILGLKRPAARQTGVLSGETLGLPSSFAPSGR